MGIWTSLEVTLNNTWPGKSNRKIRKPGIWTWNPGSMNPKEHHLNRIFTFWASNCLALGVFSRDFHGIFFGVGLVEDLIPGQSKVKSFDFSSWWSGIICAELYTRFFRVTLLGGLFVAFSGVNRDLHLGDQSRSRMEEAGSRCLMFTILPETNSEFTPENGWLETFLSFWDPAYFSGALAVSFRECTVPYQLHLASHAQGKRKIAEVDPKWPLTISVELLQFTLGINHDESFEWAPVLLSGPNRWLKALKGSLGSVSQLHKQILGHLLFQLVYHYLYPDNHPRTHRTSSKSQIVIFTFSFQFNDSIPYF